MPWAIVVFVVALAVRVVYLIEGADNPTFLQPIVDADTYDRMARSLAAGGGFDDRFFWQPFFYPTFLGTVYAVFGGSILAAKVIQAMLGATTCVLVFVTAHRVFDSPTGLVAGLITAVYGPLLFFEAELVATGWAAFWGILLLWLFLRAASGGWTVAVVGVASGLAMVTRPTFALFVAAASIWLLARGRARGTLAPDALRLLVTMAVVLGAVASLNARVTGSLSPFPSSGGVNLYIGNHPDPCETVTLRPGSEWQELNLTAASQRDAQANNAYFLAELRRFVRDEPVGVARAVLRKCIQFVNSRELPRNVDVYVFRKWSAVLSLLVWRVGPFGFPFGVLLPLAVLGLVARWSVLPPPLRLFVVLLPLSIVAVFVSARYRVVMVPVLAIGAAAGAVGIVAAVREGTLRRWLLPAAVAMTVLMASAAPGPFCEELENYPAEMDYAVGYRHQRAGELNQAIAYYSEAVREKPDYAEVYNQLAVAYRQKGQPEAALQQLQRAVQIDPTFVEARVNLGAALVRLGRLDEGIGQYQEALRVQPDMPDAHHNLGVALALAQRYDDAIAEFALAMRASRRYVRIYTDLAAQFEQEGKPEVASALRREVARVSQGGS